MTMFHGITVVQVFREMNVMPTKDKTWRVGQLAQAEYAKEFGHQPVKDNRPKTNTKGVHCFAIYPPEYREKIKSFIEQVGVEESRQVQMF